MKTLDETNKYKEIDYGISPLKIIGAIIGVTSSILGIVVVIIILEAIYIIISILVFIMICLAVFLIIVFRRLKEIINKYNALVRELKIIEDNRDTLSKMVDEKNSEIDKLEHNNHMLTAKVQLLFIIAYSDSKPESKIVSQALGIESKGDVQHEETIKNS